MVEMGMGAAAKISAARQAVPASGCTAREGEWGLQGGWFRREWKRCVWSPHAFLPTGATNTKQERLLKRSGCWKNAPTSARNSRF